MLSFILIILVICTVILWRKMNEYDPGIVIILGIVTILTAAIIFTFLVIGMSFVYIDTFDVDKKIEIYQEENKKIEEDVAIVVSNYLNHESSTFKEIIDNPTALAVVCPELKSNELVSKQIDLYIKNNKKIKDLKLSKVSKNTYEFLLYFG